MSWTHRVRSLLARRPHRTRTLLQMEAVECGAAALGSILGYHGCYVSLEELRRECGVSRDGVTAKSIVRAARRYGLEAKGMRSELSALAELPTPSILFWKFNHFVVLEGLAPDGGAFINDPAYGPRRVSAQELDEGFTGVVLNFSPGPDFVREGSEPALIPALRRRVRGSETALLFAAVAGLALVIPGLVVPVFSQVFVDQILVQRMTTWVAPLLLGMALTATLRGALTWLRSYYLLRLQTRLAVTESGRFFWHVLRLPVDFYNQRYAGDISNRVGLNDAIASLLSGRLASTAIDVLMVVFYAGLMFLYDWLLTVLSILVISFNLLAMKLVSERRVDGNRRLLQEDGRYQGTLMGGLRNIETLKATSREGDLVSKLGGLQASYDNASQELSVKTQLLTLAPSLLSGIGQAAVLAIGGLRVMQGELTMGMLVAFQSLQASFFAPVNSLLGLGGQLQLMVGNMNRLDDVLRHDPDPQAVGELEGPPAVLASSEGGPVHHASKLEGRLELRNITFGYSPLAPPLLEGFSLTLEPGQRIALVGPSGCGKSTISKLVCRLYEPWEGEILFDGIPVQELPRSVFTSSVAFVDQDLTLFEGTIRDNLTLWDPTVPDRDVTQAARDALIHQDIAARTGGYRHRLNEGGGNFSGGQRQRLDIARALASNPRILILDEATSALDTVTEEAIDRNIRRRGCSCLIVAHRLSTIRDCDEIIVLNGGKVVQRGSHRQMMTEPESPYARLLEVTA